MSRAPDPRRFALWAAALLLPLAVSAVALPYLRRHLGGGAVGQAATAAARAAGGAGRDRAAQAEAALGPGEPAAPPRRDGPTGEEIEANRAAQEALGRAQRSWRGAETMAPRAAQRDASGELVAPFQGFGLSVESTPPGATVRVDGREVGETPLVASVPCAAGAPVEVQVEKRPLRPARRSVRCREDALVSIAVALDR